MTRWFAGYDVADHLTASSVPSTRAGGAGTAGEEVPSGRCGARAAWLTGQSSWRHSRLSPAQEDVLADLAGLGYVPVPGGFPYNRAAMRLPYRPEPVLAASVRNTAQYVAARTSARFADDVVRHLQPLVDATEHHLLLLCGSTGAQLLATAAPRLRVRAGLTVTAVALGPVGARPEAAPGLQVRVLQGDRDLVSRWGYRGTPDLVVPGRHLGYATSAQVRAEVLRVAREVLA